ncbi:linear amide C-N hydrolase [Marisediminicola antarctica]|uniref:Choloylglycine hydrolase n=1 Tax=Marisediminicola antarctica TaxID=674079 RepID=A0A7L5AFD0_9MICO|nr:linear amide C-N hydrolase [Marisediminicola antarctica]QHO68877.1 choloylglycine hydrolase [Marisediminicola antarctica]
MCTGISLTATDSSVIVGRTVEWALSDAHHDRIIVVPRHTRFTALTPQGANGMQWTGKYGYTSITAYGQDYGPDGLNENGLYVGMYYFPGFASHREFDPAEVHRTLSVGDFMRWMLSTASTVDEVLAALARPDAPMVVRVDDPRFGGAPLPFHWKIADRTGSSRVFEFIGDGELHIHNPIAGVITNSPTYDWHVTNLRNNLGLSQAPAAGVTIGGVTLTPLGGGSGLLGLPGDFTPPSRFVRAIALTASARPLPTALDAVFEAFRLLDSFSIPVGMTADSSTQATDIVSATQITVVSDLTNRSVYFHTMHDRAVRRIDLSRVDLDAASIAVFDDPARIQSVRDLV